MDSKTKELRTNTIIIAISNIGSKAILFFLAPLYSYFLTTSEYGTMDLIISSVSLLGPFFCLDIYEGAFRFASDKEKNEKEIYSTSIIVCLIGIAISFLVIIISFFLKKDLTIVALTCAFTILTTINNTLSQFARGKGEMRVFAFSGVLSAIVLFGFDIVFLVLLKQSLSGWMIAYLLSKVGTTVYLFIRTKFIKRFSIKYIHKSSMAEMLKYCIPLMPAAIMWWIMNVSDRYMLSFFIGTAATGIYAVSAKIPSILSIFENIFYQAWQTTAIRAMDDNDRGTFYSNVLNNYIKIILVGICGLLLITKPAIDILFASDYHSAWQASGLLLLSIAVHAVAGILGALYTTFKYTKGAFLTSAFGAVTNIVLNIILIPLFGIVGAAITTLIGYCVTLIVRWYDVKKLTKLQVDIVNLAPLFVLVIVQCILYYFNNPYSYITRTLLAFFMVIKERNIIVKLIKR